MSVHVLTVILLGPDLIPGELVLRVLAGLARADFQRSRRSLGPPVREALHVLLSTISKAE